MTKMRLGSWLASRLAVVPLRTLVPAVLAAMALPYEFAWRDRLLAAGTAGQRFADVLAMGALAAAMAWWGIAVSRARLQRATGVDASISETARLLEQRNRQLQVVLQASRVMSAALDFPVAAAAVVEQVVAYTRFHRAVLVDVGDGEGEGEVTIASSAGLSEPHLEAFLKGLRGPKQASSPVEWCRLTRQPVVVEELSRDFRTAGMSDVFAVDGLKGMIAVPLVWREEFRGVLIAYLDSAGPISTGEVSLVSALAGQGALALENARLFTATARSRQELDRAIQLLEGAAAGLARTKTGILPLLQGVAKAAAELFQPACVRLVLGQLGRQGPQVVSEHAACSPQGLAVPEPAISLPITLDGVEFGQLELCLPGENRHVDEDERRTLQSFVHLTASALGNAALVADLRQAVVEVEQAYMGTLEALIKALEIRDHETEGHSRRVVQYTMALAQHLGIAEGELVPLIRGALLHDIGKIGIPDAILRKPEPLSEPEWTVMKQHPLIGYRMLQHIDFLNQGTPVILHHHERFDGTGYPAGLAGERIPLGARIFAVADAYDAMTSDRPYRKGRGHEEALAEIRRCSETQFDPQVVAALISLPEEELNRIRGRELELVQ